MSDFFGRSWSDWIDEYAKGHQHPTNRLCHTFGIPLIAISIPLFVLGIFFSTILNIAISLFVIGWILQFVGHAFERTWPEFFKDWRFLFVGLRWWWKKINS